MTHYFTLAGMILATFVAYVAFRRLYLRYTHPLLNVVCLSAGAIIVLLLALKIPYGEYAPAKDIMTTLLGPATVGLAVPLYRHRQTLRKYAIAILVSVAAGSLLAMLLAGFIAKAGGLPREVIISILPKGVSIPFAVEIARLYQGVPALAAAFVVATGTLGSLCATWVLTMARIENPVARGLALGTVAHAQGTAAALMEGEQQGAMAGLAMILAGILTAGLAPLAVRMMGP